MRTFAAGQAALLLLAALGRPVRAQEMRGEVLALSAEHRVLYQGIVYQQTGTWLGLRGELATRQFRFELYTLAGSLGGSGDSSNPDRDARTTVAAARVAVRPWIDVGLAAEAWHFASAVSETTWRLFGPVARAEGDLGLPVLHGFAELTLLPLAWGSSAVAPTSGARGVVGLLFVPATSPFMLRLAYRFERFNVGDPAASAPRREHVEGVQIGAGVRLGR